MARREHIVSFGWDGGLADDAAYESQMEATMRDEAEILMMMFHWHRDRARVARVLAYCEAHVGVL